MIYLLTTPQHLCLEEFLAERGAAFASRLVPLTYGALFSARELPAGTYIFSDFERLSKVELERAAQVWDQLAARGSAVRLLNPPTRVKRRFELLRTLSERNLNDFDVYRLDEARVPRRFPVFARGESGHDAVVSALLPDALTLERWQEERRARGLSSEGTLLIEFSGGPDERGLYRRYAAWKVGERILPADIFYKGTWEVRGHDLVVDEHTIAEEERFLNDNPHEAQLREVFALAGVEYGRVDYGVVDGRVQVFEINTNPYIAPSPLGGARRAHLYEHFSRAFLSALAALDGPVDGAARLKVRPPARPAWPIALRLWTREAMYGALWRVGREDTYVRRLRLSLRLLGRVRQLRKRG